MNEPDGYVFTKNAIASNFASTYPSFEINACILMHFRTYFVAFSYVIYLRKLHRILCKVNFAFHAIFGERT